MPSPVLYASACRCRSLPHRRPWKRKISMPRTLRCFWHVRVEKMAIGVSVRTRGGSGSKLQPEEGAARAPAVRRPACRRCSCRVSRARISRAIPKPSLPASVDTFSNSSLPHNPPRSGLQSQPRFPFGTFRLTRPLKKFSDRNPNRTRVVRAHHF
jgi:hypothetical protein